jgi:hypothetical protein
MLKEKYRRGLTAFDRAVCSRSLVREEVFSMHPSIPTPLPSRMVFATFVAAMPAVATRPQGGRVRLIADVPSFGGDRKASALEPARCGEIRCGEIRCEETRLADDWPEGGRRERGYPGDTRKASAPRRGTRVGAASKQSKFVNLKVAVH